jgi:hypothetical protein
MILLAALVETLLHCQSARGSRHVRDGIDSGHEQDAKRGKNQGGNIRYVEQQLCDTPVLQQGRRPTTVKCQGIGGTRGRPP